MRLRDSGISWINTMPEDWQLKKIKYTLQTRNENNKPIKSRDILSLTAKQGVIPLEEKEGGGNKPKEDYSAYKLAYPGDIVMNSMNVLSGAVGLSNYFGCVSPVYYLLRPIKVEDDVRFFNYIFQTTVFQKSLLGLGNGILMKESDNGKLNTIRMRIPMDKLGSLYIPVPDSDTQKRIADYLDATIPEIDELISSIEEEIATLEEYKKSVITEKVTKGLNNQVRMKDSGVEGIGMVPEHWEVKRAKYVCDSLSKGNGITKDDVIEGGDIQCVRYGEIYSRYDEAFTECYSTTDLERITTPKHILPGDILFAGTGELIEEIGKNVVYMGMEPCLAGGDIIIMKHSQDPVFLNYAMNCTCSQAQKSKGKTKLKVVHISATDIGNVRIALPPIEEQKKIGEYLSAICFEVNSAVEGKQEQILILEEYKRNVMYEFVTGKREVPANA